MLLIPTGNIVSIIPRFIASIGGFIIGINFVAFISPLPSLGRIKGSTTLPKRFSPTGILSPLSLIKTLSPILNPSIKPKGETKNFSPLTSVTIPSSLLPSSLFTSFTISPILGFNPCTSMIVELTLVISPNIGERSLDLSLEIMLFT